MTNIWKVNDKSVEIYFTTYSTLIVYFSETFLVQPDVHPFYKHTILMNEFLVGMVCVSTAVIPFMIATFFLQKTEPLHRFFAEVLEVHPAFDLPSVPLILFVVWSICQCCNVACVFLVIPVLYMKFLFMWVGSLQPTQIKKIQTTKHYRTLLGWIDEAKLMQMYRTHQVCK